MRNQGTITAFSPKGFGFAECDDTHLVVFIHAKSVQCCRCPHVGDRIEFDVVPSEKYQGKLDGVNVTFIDGASQ